MKKKAFTLLELSLVILIISILVVGSMSASISSINKAKYKVSKDRINQVYNALGAYLIINKALPCPASLLEVKTSANYGLAGSDGVCNNIAGVYQGAAGNAAELVYGAIPVQTLGLPAEMAEDGFDSKFTYVVSKKFTNPDGSGINGFGTVNPAFGFTSTTSGFISIVERTGTNFYNNTHNAIFAIISHGKNKYGAVNANSSTKNSSTGSDVLEQANFISAALTAGVSQAATFYSANNYFVASAADNDVFDDILFYKTRNQIVVDFNAHNLIFCPALTALSYARCSGAACDFVKGSYNQIIPSTTICSGYNTTVAKPTKRCGAFGVWEDGFVNPCTE
jgi:prepilin-type N-terminal cleavage/methylation domain-containing protein